MFKDHFFTPNRPVFLAGHEAAPEPKDKPKAKPSTQWTPEQGRAYSRARQKQFEEIRRREAADKAKEKEALSPSRVIRDAKAYAEHLLEEAGDKKTDRAKTKRELAKGILGQLEYVEKHPEEMESVVQAIARLSSFKRYLRERSKEPMPTEIALETVTVTATVEPTVLKFNEVQFTNLLRYLGLEASHEAGIKKAQALVKKWNGTLNEAAQSIQILLESGDASDKTKADQLTRRLIMAKKGPENIAQLFTVMNGIERTLSGPTGKRVAALRKKRERGEV